MKILMLTILIVGSLLQTTKVLAFGLDEIVLLETSDSHKTISINQGELEGFSEGLFAKFFIQVGDYKFPKIFLVAEGKLIKSFPKKSIWYLSSAPLPDYLKPEMHLFVLTTNQVKAGRSLKFGQKHILLPENEYQNVDQYLEQNQNNVPDRLLNEPTKYEKSFELYEAGKTPESDLVVQTYEQLKKTNGKHYSEEYNDEIEEKFYIGNLEVKIGDILNNEDKKLLDSISKGYVEKINSQKYGLQNGLYKNQKKDPGAREINSKVSIISVYDNHKEDQKYLEQVNPIATEKIKREGNQWSEDMDEVSLRRYFIRTGMLKEERRRELALNELEGNEITFHFSGSMSDHTSSAYQNYRSPGFSLGLGYDLHLSRASKDLKNWSVQFVLEKGVKDYDIGGLNARGQEAGYGAYLNYYFINNPLTLNSFIVLGGIGIKAGSIDMEAPELTKDYSYQAMTIPSFLLMTKYRFRSGDLTEDEMNVGASLNAGVNLDLKNLTVIDKLDDNINGKISIKDIKYLFGMSFYF
jgi:hypothetical protein